MKIVVGVMVILALLYILPVACSNGKEINGASHQTAYRSAMNVKRHLPEQDRVIFETAFGILDQIKSEEGPDAFSDAVDGMTAEEVIALAKEEVNKKIAEGYEDFAQYRSWEDMIAQLTRTEAKPGINR